MLFYSSLRKELSRSFGATLIVLVTVVMTMTLIRTLGMASRGSFDPSDVMLVMGYTVLAYMPTLLTMALFIAIIATLSRMYRESEMVIWLCSGRGLYSTLMPLFRFAWPVLGAVAGLALLILPWTNLRIEEMKSQYENRGDLERIEPGQFQESADGSRVFFVEKNNLNLQTGSNVFIASTEYGKESITSARKGRIESFDTGRFLMLDKGQRLEITHGSSDIKISEFDQYGSRVGNEVLNEGAYIPPNTLTTLELFNKFTPVNLAELSWRIGLILASINFVIIGIAISSVNPRVGRSANLLLALFTFVIYYNLLNLGQNWIASEKIPFAQYMVSLHASVFVLAMFWLAKDHNNWHWRSLIRKRQRISVDKELIN